MDTSVESMDGSFEMFGVEEPGAEEVRGIQDSLMEGINRPDLSGAKEIGARSSTVLPERAQQEGLDTRDCVSEGSQESSDSVDLEFLKSQLRMPPAETRQDDVSRSPAPTAVAAGTNIVPFSDDGTREGREAMEWLASMSCADTAAEKDEVEFSMRSQAVACLVPSGNTSFNFSDTPDLETLTPIDIRRNNLNLIQRSSFSFNETKTVLTLWLGVSASDLKCYSVPQRFAGGKIVYMVPDTRRLSAVAKLTAGGIIPHNKPFPATVAKKVIVGIDTRPNVAIRIKKVCEGGASGAARRWSELSDDERLSCIDSLDCIRLSSDNISHLDYDHDVFKTSWVVWGPLSSLAPLSQSLGGGTAQRALVSNYIDQVNSNLADKLSESKLHINFNKLASAVQLVKSGEVFRNHRTYLSEGVILVTAYGRTAFSVLTSIVQGLHYLSRRYKSREETSTELSCFRELLRVVEARYLLTTLPTILGHYNARKPWEEVVQTVRADIALTDQSVYVARTAGMLSANSVFNNGNIGSNDNIGSIGASAANVLLNNNSESLTLIPFRQNYFADNDDNPSDDNLLKDNFGTPPPGDNLAPAGKGASNDSRKFAKMLRNMVLLDGPSLSSGVQDGTLVMDKKTGGRYKYVVVGSKTHSLINGRVPAKVLALLSPDVVRSLSSKGYVATDNTNGSSGLKQEKLGDSGGGRKKRGSKGNGKGQKSSSSGGASVKVEANPEDETIDRIIILNESHFSHIRNTCKLTPLKPDQKTPYWNHNDVADKVVCDIGKKFYSINKALTTPFPDAERKEMAKILRIATDKLKTPHSTNKHNTYGLLLCAGGPVRRLCNKFHSNNSCNYGDDCAFAH